MATENYFTDQTFENLSPTAINFSGAEYDHCVFKNCDFSAVNLSSFVFTDCIFMACNLSMAKLTKAAFRGVKFIDCKLLGLSFSVINTIGFSVYFENCVLNHSSFYQIKTKKTVFKQVSLVEVDFTEADVSESVFDDCNLLGAIFEQSTLEKVDFRTAYNYIINPQLNSLKGAKFKLYGLPGLLTAHKIIIEA
jgi:fluoroquinolone resistance protein